MGYYTNFTLTYEIPKETKSDLDKFHEQLKKKKITVPDGVLVKEKTSIEDELCKYMDSDNSSSYGPINIFIGGNASECKWYNYDDDMRAMSKRFPTVLFTLQGEGEESDDLWIRYYRGGKCQVCLGMITYDDFDPKKLK